LSTLAGVAEQRRTTFSGVLFRASSQIQRRAGERSRSGGGAGSDARDR
jgi:hypothetical protein